METRTWGRHSKFVKNGERGTSSRFFASAVCPEQRVGEAAAVGLSKQLAEEVTCQPLEDRSKQQMVEPDRIGPKVDRVVGGKGGRLPFRPHNSHPDYLAMKQEHKGSCIRPICVKGVTHILQKSWCHCLEKNEFF